MNLITTPDKIRALRKATGASTLICFETLKKVNYDYDAALQWVKDNVAPAANLKTSDNNGVTLYYLHDNYIYGVVLTCASDFVARNEEFISFAKKICMNSLDSETANEEIELLSQRFGEKITLVSIDKKIFSENNHAVVYNHHTLRSSACLVYNYIDTSMARGKKIDKILPFDKEVIYNSLDILALKVLFHVSFVSDKNINVETLLEQKYFLDDDNDETLRIKEFAKTIEIIDVGNIVLK